MNTKNQSNLIEVNFRGMPNIFSVDPEETVVTVVDFKNKEVLRKEFYNNKDNTMVAINYKKEVA